MEIEDGGSSRLTTTWGIKPDVVNGSDDGRTIVEIIVGHGEEVTMDNIGRVDQVQK